MPERLPYWPCYASDITMSTAAMTDEQIGAYFRLLNHAWINDGLPANQEAVRQIGRWSRAAWARIWPVVGPKWPEVNGRLVNPRQEIERERAIREVKAKSMAGKKGAAGRWGSHSKANGSAIATALPSDSGGNAIHLHQQEDQKPPVAPLRGGRTPTRAERKLAKALGVSTGVVGPSWREACREAGHVKGGECQSPTLCRLRLAAEAECPHEPKCTLSSECSARSSGGA